MARITKLFLLLTMCLFAFNVTPSFADEIGVVDITKLLKNYTKAQQIATTLKTRETELDDYISDAKKSIEAAKTIKDKRALENKYNTEATQKARIYRQEEIKQLAIITNNVINAVKVVAEKNNIKVVARKDSIFYGAKDITDDVLVILNTPVTATITPSSITTPSTPNTAQASVNIPSSTTTPVLNNSSTASVPAPLKAPATSITPAPTTAQSNTSSEAKKN